MSNKVKYVATIGFFDGVHQGHKYLIRQVRDEAETRGLNSLIVTFPIHPRKVLQADFQPKLLTTCEEKVDLLKKEKIDNIVLLPFTKELAQKSAREFMQILHDSYNVEVLVIGYDHRFGHDRSDGFEDYVIYGKEMGIDVIQALEEPEGKYSSTAVRKALLDGDVAKAQSILGYPYFIQGKVVNGFHVGTKIGYPTANISLFEDKLIPKTGVYAVKVKSHDSGVAGKGMLNIGYRPTLNNGPQMSIEVHIFNYDNNLYGETLQVEFIQRIRDEIKFDCVDTLTRQLAEDEKECRNILE